MLLESFILPFNIFGVSTDGGSLGDAISGFAFTVALSARDAATLGVIAANLTGLGDCGGTKLAFCWRAAETFAVLPCSDHKLGRCVRRADHCADCVASAVGLGVAEECEAAVESG